MTENRQIYTAFNIPVIPLQPSIDCVRWTDDGQIIVASKTAIYVLTPDLGVSLNTLSLAKSAVSGEKRSTASVDLSWFKIVIGFDRRLQHIWPACSQEVGSLVLGSLDNGLRMVTVSPSNLTPEAGCLLVTLNTNLEVFVWRACLKDWTKILDITELLYSFPLPQIDEDGSQERHAYSQVLHAQVNCISWSPQADFGLTPNPLLDGSILALGTRAGSIIVMRYDGNRSMNLLTVVRVSDVWVTRLSWRCWSCSVPGESETILACGLANGSIALVRVSQRLVQSSVSPFGRNYRIECKATLLDAQPARSDGKGITALTWIESRTPALVYAKPGLFFLYRHNIPNISASDSSTILRLSTLKQSVGSSSLAQVSGLHFIKPLDVLIATLFDGSFHVVRNVSDRPTLDYDSTNIEVAGDSLEFSSENLTRSSRAVFTSVESGTIKFSDVNRIVGATPFDGMGTFAWIHESCQPNDFSYKPDARRNCMFVVSALWDGISREQLLRHLRELLMNSKSTLSQAPLHTLRTLNLHLRNCQMFDTLHTGVLAMLQEVSHSQLPVQRLDDWSGDVHDELRTQFRLSITRNLFGLDDLYRLRLRFAIADTCFNLSRSEGTKTAFGEVALATRSQLTNCFLQVVINHCAPLIHVLSVNEVPFLVRIIVQCLLPGRPESLQTDAKKLMSTLEPMFSGTSPDMSKLTETCPACLEEIPLEDLHAAICPNKHMWSRCAITSFILSTPMVRNCIGCSRKSFLPLSVHATDAAGSPSWLPQAGQTWIVEELLEAVRSCPYCGNRFVRVV